MKILDLFCGAGGAGMGYHRAGFDVVGVDIVPQPNYPFKFWQGNALDWEYFGSFDAIHASPPCQAYSIASVQYRNAGKEYPDLLAATRELLECSGLPWVIENVPRAPMRPDYKLCGCMFGLTSLRRERWFETSWHGFALLPHGDHSLPALSVVGDNTPGSSQWFRDHGRVATLEEKREAMAIDWMTAKELSLAIPPPYTEYVASQLIEELAKDA